MARIAMPSARWSRRISAQSSTLITLLTPWLASSQGSRSITVGGGPARGWVSFRLLILGQYSGVGDTGELRHLSE